MQQDSTGGRVSDDGRFVWDGNGWVPRNGAEPSFGSGQAGLVAPPALPRQPTGGESSGDASGFGLPVGGPGPQAAAAVRQVPLSGEQVDRLRAMADANLGKAAALWALGIYLLVARLAGAVFFVFGLIVLVWGVLALPVLFLIGLVPANNQKKAADSDAQGRYAERLPIVQLQVRSLNPPVYRLRTARGVFSTSKQEDLMLATAAQRFRVDLQGAYVDVTPRTRLLVGVSDPQGQPLA